MRRISMLFLLFFTPQTINSQNIYISEVNGEIYEFNIADCTYEFIVKANIGLYDITFHPNGKLYAINYDGGLYEVNIATGDSQIIYNFPNVQFFTSLTASGNGTIYAAGSVGNLHSYNLDENIGSYIGNFGLAATGDLTFYKGNLYAAVEGDNILLIDLEDVQNSTIAVSENLSRDIFGIVSYSEECNNDIDVFAITSGPSDIYRIDFENQSLSLACQLDISISGGASTFEFFSSSPIVVEGIDITPASCNESNGSITINATGGIGTLSYSIGAGFQSSNQFNGLTGDEYTITIQDGNDCFTNEEVSISSTDTPEVTNIAIIGATCGAFNGVLEVNVMNGIPPYKFSLNGIDFQSSNRFEGLAGGNYTITIQGANFVRAI